MKIFHCDHCQQLVYFENTRCVNCGRTLAFLPDLFELGSLDRHESGRWSSANAYAQGRMYRLCQNYAVESVCNWAIPADSTELYCESCRLTRVIPNLNQTGNKKAWAKMETAKRRLIYSVLALGLPLTSRAHDPTHGLAFEFLADPPHHTPNPILTGHAQGLITINLSEANDAERERRRLELGEPYRTLLGHFRHESGHYYWDRLIDRSPRLDPFRVLFGDERENYGEALKRHYRNGARPNWPDRFITAYASSHPWEDWAESWAHYLHMADTLETAAACGLALQPRRADEPLLPNSSEIFRNRGATFDDMIAAWFPLTHVLNNLNRGLGLSDGYPFIVSAPAVEKLRFIHDTIHGE